MDESWTKMNEYRKLGLFADVHFLVGDRDLRAHKVVLSSQSTVFEAMFTSGMEESLSGRVNIIDIKPDVFEVFLEYFYTHAVSESALKTHVEELLYCGDKYVVPQLTDICSKYSEKNFTLVRNLFLADMFNLRRLKTVVSEEIAKFGWGRLTSCEWFEMFTDFHLTTEVLQFVMPSYLVAHYIIKPDMWSPPFTVHRPHVARLQSLHLRNNGGPCEISVTMYSTRKTIRCSVEYHPGNDGPKVVEISFEFSIGYDTKFCGKGDVWWDAADMSAQDIFDHTFQLNDAIINTTLEFNLTLRQWSSPEPKLPPHTDHIDSDSVEPGTVVLHISGETFEVNKSLVCRESDYFKKLMFENRSSYEILHVDVEAFRKIHHYMCTGVTPLQADVNFPMILCAHSLGLINLQRYCDRILALSLDDSLSPEMLGKSINSLIFAADNNFELLRDSALTYIDSHLKEVINSDAWERLQDRPDLVFSIIQKMFSFTHPCWSDGPDSDFDCGSETEIESIIDSNG